MFKTESHSLQFRFKVRFRPNLVSVGTQRIGDGGNARVKSRPLWSAWLIYIKIFFRFSVVFFVFFNFLGTLPTGTFTLFNSQINERETIVSFKANKVENKKTVNMLLWKKTGLEMFLFNQRVTTLNTIYTVGLYCKWCEFFSTETRTKKFVVATLYKNGCIFRIYSNIDIRRDNIYYGL